ncbi:MAG: DsbC family protein [Gammaproteobacteria bacterium]|nr:DsbC family protein [Gammaproteobacteria bacterium]
MKKCVMIVMLLCFSLQLTYADEVGLAKVQSALQSLMPGAKPDSVAESVIPGIYEAVFGAQVVYVTGDGRFMIEGDVYDINRRVNLTEGKRQDGRIRTIKSLDPESLITFKPKETKYVVTAFTDIDCGYCRKLHAEISDYNDLGIEIRYAAFPRSGPQTTSYFKAVSVWCAEDRGKAMDFAKGGAKLEQLQKVAQVNDSKACEKSVQKHSNTARDVGVTGTPTLFMENGQIIPGYVPADRLIKILSGKNS